MDFDPNLERSKCEQYLCRSLSTNVKLVKAQKMIASSRQAPWRLDVELDGMFQSYVLRLNVRQMEHEYHVLQAMQSIPIPTPRVYGWDPEGSAFGVPVFLSEFISGESLLPDMLAGKPWAEDLYLDTVSELQSLTRQDLIAAAAYLTGSESAADVLDQAHEYLLSRSDTLLTSAYQVLQRTMPDLPETRFSNGDLWLDNFLVQGRELSGVIDFENACFGDPIFEFLLTFFVRPELTGRGIETRYCQRMGFDPNILHWYHGLEFYDTLYWVLKTGESLEHHTGESLRRDLEIWRSEPDQNEHPA